MPNRLMLRPGPQFETTNRINCTATHWALRAETVELKIQFAAKNIARHFRWCPAGLTMPIETNEMALRFNEWIAMENRQSQAKANDH